MPSLLMFGRRWRIGSDDFVFPGCFEATIRITWLILTIVLFVEHLNDSQNENHSSCEKGEVLIRIYLIGMLAILFVSLLLSVLLTIHSAKGSIMDTIARQHVPKIIVLRVFSGMFEVGWNILGTVWIYSSEVECKKDSSLWMLLRALVVYTWVAIFLLLFLVFMLFGSMKRPDREESMSLPTSILDATNAGIGSHYIQLWERRCRILCCTFAKDDNSAEAFRSVADVLASVFEETDMVASDIAAALVLLRLKKKREEAYQEVEHGPHRISEPLFPESDRPEWMTLENCVHFMKFALGSYGWAWYMYDRLLSAGCQMWPFVRCCGGCRRRGSSMADIKDNCCLCNLAALRAITNLPEENIIYLSFHNKIYEAPFFVAIDDETKHVVVAIRGTLSLYDAITDLNAQSTLLAYEGLPAGCRAHKGMVNVAQFVKRKLDETQALPEAMAKRTGYGLVITGHSLGAGAAVLLAAMYRPEYPDLKCFAFSPPGGLCSIEMYTATQSFVMSVAVGDDLVPRLSISAIHDLHNKINNVLNTCRIAKYRVLAKGCWYMLFGISKASLQSCASRRATDEHLISPNNSGAFNYESLQDIQYMFCEDPPRPLPRHTETLLFPPGRILYLTPKPGVVDKQSAWNVRWARNSEFQQILITPLMLRHHLPHFVLAALQTALTTSAPIS